MLGIRIVADDFIPLRTNTSQQKPSEKNGIPQFEFLKSQNLKIQALWFFLDYWNYKTTKNFFFFNNHLERMNEYECQNNSFELSIYIVYEDWRHRLHPLHCIPCWKKICRCLLLNANTCAIWLIHVHTYKYLWWYA